MQESVQVLTFKFGTYLKESIGRVKKVKAVILLLPLKDGHLYEFPLHRFLFLC